MRTRLFLLLSIATIPASARAQDTGDHHADADSDIVVTAIYARSQADILSGTSILTDQELVRDLRPTIGETLTRQAGVSATSFGPNASRPVLRGFQGERVRVLTDGIGSFDVSNTSVDHAVVLNPLTADRIEVLRGPAALLFGSSAIGGVVNVIDSRIPRRKSDEGIHIDSIATYGSSAKEKSLGGKLDLPLGGRLVGHIDASWSKTGDLKTGGFILTPALRAQAAASGDPETQALADLRGSLPNSAARTWEVAGGLAWIGDIANFGVSVARFDSLYGVPIRFATTAPAPGEESPGAVRLDVRQWRYDARGEINPQAGFVEAIRLRAGYADYQHDELEEDGAIGTSFFSKGKEGRLELVQREKNGWKGAIGVQFLDRKLNIIGAEKYLPRISTQQYGLFTVQSLDLGGLRTEAGGRIERTRASAAADTDLGNSDLKRRFTSLSGSLGGSLEVLTGWRIGFNGSYAERAPSPEELYPNGPHAGTQAFEIGNPLFDKERSKGLELTVRGSGRRFNVSASVYKSWFSNFIYELPNGLFEDGLPVFVFQQDKASYVGAEVDASVTVVEAGNWKVNLDSVADFTQAKIKRLSDTSYAPRIPARRVLTGIEAQSPHVDLRAEVEFVDGQKRVAPAETRTPGYKLVNLSAALRPWGEDGAISLTLSANNLFGVTARRHASFLKDYAPLSGRDIRLTARVSF
jgi:iron complex outermembrane receptor protein